MEFFAKSQDSRCFVSNPGKRYKTEYRGKLNDDGFIELIPVGVIDLQQMHNADAESCDINNIVNRFANGDVTALNSVQGSYIDVAGLPKDLRGMNELISGLKYNFVNLDPEISKKFKDFDDWLGKAGSEEWIKIMTNNKNIKESNNIDQDNIKNNNN